jgi:hypothetical protein
LLFDLFRASPAFYQHRLLFVRSLVRVHNPHIQTPASATPFGGKSVGNLNFSFGFSKTTPPATTPYPSWKPPRPF